MEYFLAKQKPKISKKAKIAKSAVIEGNVVIEDGVKIFDHSAIIGPCYIGKNAVIANNSLVRNSIINENSVVGYSTEVARSYLANNVWTHHNYMGDSIIDEGTTFGAGTITGNLRFDNGAVYVNIKGERIRSSMEKLGGIIGKNCKFGINVSIMPGKKIGKNCLIGPHSYINQDIADDSFVYQQSDIKICKKR